MADYSSFKTVLNDEDYANKINNFMDAVEVDVNSKLDTSAVTFKSIVSKTSDFSVADSDYTLEIDATVADVTAILPDPITNTGRILVFRKVDETGYQGLIGTVHTLYNKDEFVSIQSNGTAWVRIG